MLKKVLSKIRTYVKVLILIILATLIILSIVALIYKPTYQVSLNGELIGYSRDKSELQSKINNYMENGNSEDIAFVQINELPEYKMCLLKKNIEYNDDEIYSKKKEKGVPYYKYYALTINGEEKAYVKNFEEAENVVSKLKEKNSKNKDTLAISEKYDTSLKEFTDVETCVSKLYEEQPKTVVTTTKISKTNTEVSTKKSTNIGIDFINPVSGTITSRFGSRWGSSHKGIDIGAPKGTSIKAAASGTVVVSSGGYNGGYGNYIIISHGNGIQTYYAHCSKLYASVGQSVAQGEVIAAVGSTGRSTGNHLHFEVRINGVAKNPLNYTY